jgi:hypothetical protein
MLPDINSLLADYMQTKRWMMIDTCVDTITVGHNLKIALAGFTARNEVGQIVAGSAGSINENPELRARFELLERMRVADAFINPNEFLLSKIDLDGSKLGWSSAFICFHSSPRPSLWTYARSNGFSLHTHFGLAVNNAAFELIERELILRSWAGKGVPQQIEDRQLMDGLQGLSELYKIDAYSFGSLGWKEAGKEVFVRGFFLFPLVKDIPLCYGFGASDNKEQALMKAKDECLQRLGFLWGEEIPKQEPEFAPNPQYHQEYYLYPEHHKKLKNWLLGKRTVSVKAGLEQISIQLYKFDRNNEPTHLVYATSEQVLPLAFGKATDLYGDLFDEDSLIHPVV